MSMTYGVVPEGFRRKPLDRILFELETSARTIFGPDVILDPESPMGQFLGLMALIATQLWEIAEETYQSYDPDQAEGLRLDTLARIRVIQRASGESDAAFRHAITNQGRARNDIQDLARAVRGLDGVTYTQVFVNDGSSVDENNLSPGSVAIAVLGGDEEEIAAEARRFIVPGINTSGNVAVSTDIDGFCRTIYLLRPILIPVKLTISVRTRRDRLGCPPPPVGAIRAGLVEDFAEGGRRLLNGDDITLYRIRSVIESRHSTVEVVSFVGERDEIVGSENEAVSLGFIELATVALDDVTIAVVE